MDIKFLWCLIISIGVANISFASTASSRSKNENFTHEERGFILSMNTLGIDLVKALHLSD